MAVDLHVHSTCSDGTLTPVQVVRAAASKGLSALALADHDTVAGVLPALRIAARHGLDLFPAVEVSAQHGRQELHILGFLIDLDEPELAGALVRVREGREDRLERIVSTRFVIKAYRMVQAGWSYEKVDSKLFSGWREDEIRKAKG